MLPNVGKVFLCARKTSLLTIQMLIAAWRWPDVVELSSFVDRKKKMDERNLLSAMSRHEKNAKDSFRYSILIKRRITIYLNFFMLPNFTFFHGIHSRAFGTIEIEWKLSCVAYRTNHTEFIWRMHAGRNFVFVVIRSSHCAPCLCCRNPKHLRWRVLESGQFRFGTIAFNPFLIGDVGLFDATVVGNVLALCIDAIQLKRKKTKKKKNKLL